jgi:hypothetical protein
MTNIYYDTEFLEDGRTIELISIGMIREDGTEYYAVNADMPVTRIWRHPWLRENVLPSLPVIDTHSIHLVRLDYNSIDVKPRQVIANEVREFVLGVPDPRLWAWYGAYDHVALCQLYGPMIVLPPGFPMHTNDLKQTVDDLGGIALPSMPGITEHNALDDARELRYRARWLRERELRIRAGTYEFKP